MDSGYASLAERTCTRPKYNLHKYMPLMDTEKDTEGPGMTQTTPCWASYQVSSTDSGVWNSTGFMSLQQASTDDVSVSATNGMDYCTLPPSVLPCHL